MRLVRHLKSGRIYRVLYDENVVDCTNSRDGLPVVVYTRHPPMCAKAPCPKVFVREKAEFLQKYEALEAPPEP